MNKKTRVILSLFLCVSLLNLPFNPFVFVSANGSIPVKISSSNAGETWLMPNGDKIAKLGGEPTAIENGITVEGTTVKSSTINVNIESLVESEIIYENDIGTIAKENWFIYENGNKLTWDSFSEKNLIIDTVPILETVGSYIVTDYAAQAVKEKTMNNIFGSLWIEYKIIEGKPLKHTLNFTSQTGGAFKLCQEFTEFDFDEIEKFDHDSMTLKTIDADIIKSEKMDILSLDIESKSKDLKQEIKNDPLLLLPEIVEFKKNGKFILGEITSGAKSDFQSFEYDSITKTASFCYGDFVLNSGESFVVDPDTYSSNNPTEDGQIQTNDATGVSCPAGATESSSGNGIDVIVSNSGTIGSCSRGYIEFNISSIPAGATVTDTVIKFEVYAIVGTAKGIDWNPMMFQPSISVAATIWGDAGNGTSYVTNGTTTSTVGTNKSLDLGTNADTDISSQVGLGWWAVGMKLNDETRDASASHGSGLRSEEFASTPDPTLEVTYQTEYDLTVDIDYFNGTAKTANVDVKLTNTTSTYTESINPTGHAKFYGISGTTNNVTAIMTDIDYVGNKTVNFTPLSSLLSIDLNNYRGSCLRTGSDNDFDIITNQSNGHYFGNHTRPLCSNSNVISYNITAIGLGKNGATFFGDIRLMLLNMTAFGKNALLVLINGASVSSTYSNGVISVSDFSFGSGTASSTLYKFYIWLDPKPDNPTGLGLSVVSGTALDLSWTAGNTGVSSISGYAIYRGTDGTNFPTLVTADTGSTATTYLDSGLTAGTTYYYKVAAINSYGTGNNSTSASETTTPASTPGGGSSGGGGGGTITNNFQQLSIIPKKLTIMPNQVTSGEIDVTWSSGSDLVINTISYGTTDFILKFSLPLTLKGSGGTVSTDKIMFNVVAPKQLTQKSYSIPITMTGELENFEVTQQGTIIIDTIGDTSIVLFIILLMIGFTSTALLYRKFLHKKLFNKKKDGTVLKKLRKIEHEFEKPMKNGTSLKKLKNFKI